MPSAAHEAHEAQPIPLHNNHTSKTMPDAPLPEDLANLEGDDLVDLLTSTLYTALAQWLRAGGASTELLGVARAALKDTGTGPVNAADQKALRVVYRAFVRALRVAVTETPTASVLEVARRFLKDCGLMPNYGQESEALQKLESAHLPFNAAGKTE